MSRLETVALALTHGLAEAARPAPERLRRALAGWPVLLIALGGVLTILWAIALAWGTFRLAAWLV